MAHVINVISYKVTCDTFFIRTKATVRSKNEKLCLSWWKIRHMASGSRYRPPVSFFMHTDHSIQLKVEFHRLQSFRGNHQFSNRKQISLQNERERSLQKSHRRLASSDWGRLYRTIEQESTCCIENQYIHIHFDCDPVACGIFVYDFLLRW